MTAVSMRRRTNKTFKRAATGRLVFSAHYDSKTDLLDHLLRAPLTMATVPCSLLLVVTALAAWRRRWPKLKPVAQSAALLSGLSTFLVFTGGAFVSSRSQSKSAFLCVVTPP